MPPNWTCDQLRWRLGLPQMSSKVRTPLATPRSSWTTAAGERVSPLAGLSQDNPRIDVTENMRARADRELEKRTRPYKGASKPELLAKRGR